jgi:hypothetical protein
LFAALRDSTDRNNFSFEFVVAYYSPELVAKIDLTAKHYFQWCFLY